MNRTQISLDDEDRRILDAESRRTGRSMSSLIRDAVREVYAPRDVDGKLRALEDAAGSWPAETPDGADYVEAIRTGERWRELYS